MFGVHSAVTTPADRLDFAGAAWQIDLAMTSQDTIKLGQCLWRWHTNFARFDSEDAWSGVQLIAKDGIAAIEGVTSGGASPRMLQGTLEESLL